MTRTVYPALLLTITLGLSAGGASAHEAIGRAAPDDREAIEAVTVGPLDHAIPSDAIAKLRAAPRALYVSKTNRTLTLLEYGRRVKTYPVAIGKTPEGPKQRLGDGKTPEGLYYIAAHHPESRFHKALKVSYPNAADAERGLRQRLITPAQAESIRNAHASRKLPPQNTRLGRYIEIHGGYRLAKTGPGERPWIYAWTDGCIAVTDEMINEIYDWTPAGAPVLIQA